MSGGHDEWCLIESDPGVFTELIRGFGMFWNRKKEFWFFLLFSAFLQGATGVQVEELYSLEPECFENLKYVSFVYSWDNRFFKLLFDFLIQTGARIDFSLQVGC